MTMCFAHQIAKVLSGPAMWASVFGWYREHSTSGGNKTNSTRNVFMDSICSQLICSFVLCTIHEAVVLCSTDCIVELWVNWQTLWGCHHHCNMTHQCNMTLQPDQSTLAVLQYFLDNSGVPAHIHYSTCCFSFRTSGPCISLRARSSS